MNFNGYSNFNEKLHFGNKLEACVKDNLQAMLPEKKVILTNQERFSEERDKYSLCDVIVLSDSGDVVFGVECKHTQYPFRKCPEIYGWAAEKNVPINSSSLNTYRTAKFPFFILCYNEWCQEFLTSPIKNIDFENTGSFLTKYKDNRIININATDWYSSSSLDDICLYYKELW